MGKNFGFKKISIMVLFAAIAILGASLLWSQNLSSSSGHSELPVVLVFETRTCPACIEQKPILEEVKNNEDFSRKFNFYSIELRDARYQDFARKFGINATPTFVVLSTNGQVLYKEEGLHSKIRLENALLDSLQKMLDGGE